MKKFLLTLTTLMSVTGAAIAAPLHVTCIPSVVARPILPAPIVTAYVPTAPLIVATVPAERIVYRRPFVIAHRRQVIVAHPRIVF